MQYKNRRELVKVPKHKIYTFYAELDDYEPKAWRRFEIDAGKNIAEFAYTIMIMFEMHASHLFKVKEFTREAHVRRLMEWNKELSKEEIVKKFGEDDTKNRLFEIPFDDDDDIFLLEDKEHYYPQREKPKYLYNRVGNRLELAYDYGDNWHVNLTLESVEEKEISLKDVPRVLEGEGYGIIEDVGGTGGLTELYDLTKNKVSLKQEYEDMLAWLDSDGIDLDEFDIEDINFRIKKLMRVYRDLYEYGWEPTIQSEKIFNRAYKGKGRLGY